MARDYRLPPANEQERRDARPRLYLSPARRDGKIPACYVFPTSGRTIRKLLTPERVEVERASGSYLILPGGN
jgi:mRNA-degrading endonuclease toxin of MazEF toxin-antitoxin module